jgi:hypothetical protein
MRKINLQAVVCELLAYVDENPSASDSVAGIQRWWLKPAEGVDVQAVKDAVNYLVGRGAFSVRVAADGRRRYRRGCTDSELKTLLAELEAHPSAGDDCASDAER